MTANATFLAPIGSGIGDVVVAMPVFEWLIGRGEGPVYLVARGPRQLGFEQAIPGLAGVVREVDLADVLAKTAGARYINLRDHDIQRNYDWYGARFDRDYPGFRINDIMREVCKSFGLFPDLSRFPRLNAVVREEFADKVAIIPGATSDFKAPPVVTWHEVVEGLRRRGERCVMLGEPDRSPIVAALKTDGVEHAETPSIQDAIDLLSSVRGVISVDTGLMHIAVQQNIPTVAIFNDVRTYYREAPNCRPVFGPSCAPECTMRTDAEFPYCVDYKEWIWWEGKYDFCRSAEPCMTKIKAADLLAAFDELLAPIP